MRALYGVTLHCAVLLTAWGPRDGIHFHDARHVSFSILFPHLKVSVSSVERSESYKEREVKHLQHLKHRTSLRIWIVVMRGLLCGSDTCVLIFTSFSFHPC